MGLRQRTKENLSPRRISCQSGPGTFAEFLDLQVSSVAPSLRRSRSDPCGLRRRGNLTPSRPCRKSLRLNRTYGLVLVDLLVSLAMAGRSPSCSVWGVPTSPASRSWTTAFAWWNRKRLHIHILIAIDHRKVRKPRGPRFDKRGKGVLR